MVQNREQNNGGFPKDGRGNVFRVIIKRKTREKDRGHDRIKTENGRAEADYIE